MNFPSRFSALMATAFIVAAAPCAYATEMQLFPPVVEGTVDTTCAPGARAPLTWDGQSNVACAQGVTIAGGNIALANGNITIANGDLGIGTLAPASQLANNSTNRLDYTGNGVSTTAINWTASAPGYLAGFENLSAGNYFNGLLVKTTDVSANSNILDLMSGGTSRFIVNGNGNVGIGITNPFTDLQVVGKAQIGTNTLDSFADSSVILQIMSADGTNGSMLFWQPGIAAGLIGTKANDPNFYITNDWSDPGIGAVDYSLTLTPSGYLGIKTANPIMPLDVQFDIDNAANYWGAGQIVTTGATNTNKRLVLGFDTTLNVGFIQPYINGTGYNNLLLDPAGGNVGIGNLNPSYSARRKRAGAVHRQLHNLGSQAQNQHRRHRLWPRRCDEAASRVLRLEKTGQGRGRPSRRLYRAGSQGGNPRTGQHRAGRDENRSGRIRQCHAGSGQGDTGTQVRER